jgi:hypothetical protein
MINLRTERQKQRERTIQSRLMATYESRMAKGLRREFNRVGTEAGRQYTEFGTILNVEQFKLDHQENLRKIIFPVAIAAGNKFADRVKTVKSGLGFIETKNDDQFQRDLNNFVNNEAGDHVVDISDTTLKQIRAALAKITDEGVGQEAGGRIIEQMTGGAIGANRARVISRTEVHGATQYASESQMNSIGVAYEKEWVSSQGPRTRDRDDAFDHKNANGQKVPKGEKFKIKRKRGGYELIMRPGDPKGSAGNVINCRCVQVYNVIRGTEPVLPEVEEVTPPPPATVDANLPRPQGFAEADRDTKEWIEASINDPKYAPIVQRVPSPKALNRRREGAYYMRGGNGSINMSSYSKTDERGRMVYRHEFGHHIDVTTGNHSSDINYERLRIEETTAISDSAKAYFNDARDRGLVPKGTRYSSARVRQVYEADADQYYNQIIDDGDPVAWFKSNSDPNKLTGLLADVLNEDYINSRPESAYRLMAKMVAVERAGAEVLIADVMYRSPGSTLLFNVPHSIYAADLLGAITNESFGGGHGKNYYKQRRYLGISVGNNTEAFANVFALASMESGALGLRFTQVIAPRLLKYLERLNDGLI